MTELPRGLIAHPGEPAPAPERLLTEQPEARGPAPGINPPTRDGRRCQRDSWTPSSREAVWRVRTDRSRKERRMLGEQIAEETGKLLEGGAVSYRGASYYSDSPNFRRLNAVAVVFEYSADADGNSKSKAWEWK